MEEVPAMPKPVYKKTELGELPEEWEVVRIKDIGKVKGGKRIPKGEKFADEKTPYPYIRVVDMKNGSVDTSNLMYLRPDTHKKIRRYTISSNDVYITIAGTIGLAGVIPEEIDGANLTENAAKITDLKNLDKYFLAYILNSPLIQSQIKAYTGKATQPKLALFRIEKIKLPLPPLPEQRRIAAVLRTVDEGIEKTEEEIARTERLKKGLMQRLLTKGIGHEKFKKTEIGELPEEWEVVRLGEVGSLQYGYTTSATQDNTGIKFIRITDITEDGRIMWEKVPYCHISTSDLSKYQAHKGDILFARIGATAGKAGYVDRDSIAIFASYLIRLSSNKDKADSSYIFYTTQSKVYWKQAMKQREGQLKKGINSKMLSNIKIPLPPLEEQRKIAEILRTVDERLELLRERKEKLERVKKGLMNDLLTGRRRVPEGVV